MSHIPKPSGLRAPTTKVPKTDTGNKENVSKNLHEEGSMRRSEIRKVSDVSLVLTTDTDSFIVGDRVWVGGTKPGHIQFIGETQFAPGEWAGVVLDETVGKNDGSVGGVKYFQCAPKRGVFSRLSRLTREPVDLPDESIFQPPDGNASSTPLRKTPERCISPNSSICSRKSSSPYAGNTTVGGSMNLAGLSVGERVIVTSMQGSKTGVLRYLGPTEFAQGQWAGVELDEPDGKNDGSVAGKRYFECQPKHGLFTPASKVFRSPANAMRKVSAAYKMTRQSSRDSMQSMLSNTSRISNFTSASIRRPSRPSMNTTLSAQQAALQETIREKEKHIEQILKERELDRAEAARALIAASDAEKKLADLEEKLRNRDEKGSPVERLTEQLAAAEAARKELLSQLEDERRKNEDQQFRFEEESICKTELEAVNEANQKKIDDLENQLKRDKEQIEEYERQSKKERDKIEESFKLIEKVKNLEDALNLEKNELNRILVEHVKEIEVLEQKNLEEVEKEKKHLQRIIDETKCELTKALIRHDEELKEVEEKRLSLQAENDNLKSDIEKVKSELANFNFSRSEENGETVKELNLKDELIIKLKSELDKLKEFVKNEELELEKKINNATIQNEKLKELIVEKDLAIDKLSLAKIERDTSLDEKKKLVDDLKNQLEKSQNELLNVLSENQKLKEVGKEKGSKIDLLSTTKIEIEKALEQNRKIVTDLNNQLETNVNELKSKSNENEELKAKHDLEMKVAVEKYEIQLTNLGIKLTTLEEELKSRNENLTKSLKDAEDRSIQLEKELDLLRKEAKSLADARCLLEEEKNKSEEELVGVKNNLTNLDNERLILEQKVSSLEVENSSLTKEIGELTQSRERFKKENETLNNRLEELENLRNDLLRKNQEIEESGARLRKELEELQKCYKDQKRKLEEEIEDLSLILYEEKIKLSTSEANLGIQIKSRQDLEAKLQSADNTLLKDLSLANKELTNFQQENCELSAKVKNLENLCEKLRSDSEHISQNLKAKNEELRHITDTLSKTKEEFKNSSSSSDKKIEELQSIFNTNLSERSKLSSELNHHKNQIETIKEKIVNAEKEKVLILADKDAEITELCEAVRKAENKVSEMESSVLNSEKELVEKEEKLLLLLNDNKKLSTDLESEKIVVANLSNKWDAENSEKGDLMVKLSEKDQKLAELSDQNATLSAALLDEKRLLATLSNNLEFENSEKKALLSKISSLELEFAENKSKLVLLNAELDSYKTKYDSNLTVMKDRDNEIQYLKSSLNATSESLLKSQIEADNKAKKLDLLEKQLSQLTSKIVGLGEAATQLEQSLVAAGKEKADLLIQIDTLEREVYTLNVDGNKLSDLESLNQSLQMELERLKEELSSKEVRYGESAKEKKNEFEELKQNLDSESKKRKELENEKILLGGIIIEKERLIKDLESQTDNMKSTLDETERKLNERILKAEGESRTIALQAEKERSYLATIKGEIENMKLEKEELIKKIIDLKKTCSETKKDFLLVESSGEEKKKLMLEKDNLMKRLLSVEENASTAAFSYEEEKLNLLESLEAVKKELEIKTFENRELLEKVQSFEGDSSRSSSLKLALSVIEKEKNQLNSRIDKLQEQLKRAQEECSELYQGTDEQTLMLRESKKNLEQQVSFLNSVIVDMQKKNENLKTEMEILRATLMGHGVTDHNSNRKNGIPNHRSLKSKPPPRLYCDICEAFDTHDTEDCPTQSSEAYLADQQVGQDPKKAKASDRPYCETCEIFGHTIEECEDGESF